MKKIWPIVLLGILLLCISCVKEKAAETDLIFEGKTYVIGSGKPPKGQPMKMLIRQAYTYMGVKLYETVDSFYTDSNGFFSYLFKPVRNANEYLIVPSVLHMYENIDLFVPKKLGKHQINFRIHATSILRLRLKNGNFNFGDSLTLIDPENFIMAFSGPVALDNTINLPYPSYEPLNFRFRLFRNGVEVEWNELYILFEDSIHYHEIIY